jgi:imidazolonepropionase-like amidohydrolase
MEAIMAATKVNAEIMDLDKQIGTIEPGKQADLIMVEDDPLKDISILTDRTKIKKVVLSGEVVVDRRE